MSTASAMSAKRISHPMLTMGSWDIIEFISDNLKDMQNFGQFTYDSSIPINIPGKGEVNVGADLSRYGCQNSKLLRNQVYLLFGRLVKNLNSSTFSLFFEQQLTMPIGPSSQYKGKDSQPSSLIGKVGVFGFRVVEKTQEIVLLNSRDPSEQAVVTFSTIYTVPANNLLKGTFSGFHKPIKQYGAAAPPTPTPSSANYTSDSLATPGKHGDVVPVPSSELWSMSPTSEDEEEEGEISDKENDTHFSNTYRGTKKRSAAESNLDGAETLAAAQKRMRNLL
ncbi:hypothetical protein PCANC_22140 [Puccinia coronata f. sp. avenae]|uniref:Uncharacterized protein n=1 Tax=Puccinia coronata f. sp. avenae TaxID=200324 RepID=A0A2N5TXF5_9BASI|nr:hypothetical protein PCANC_22140 [Puccinia coronata f. sp. avenae]PLW36345.1 hypothetical protein PCASD_18659 [Puccinia coronata f. sp. avenae]